MYNKGRKGISQLSNEYGIPKGTISTWIKTLTPIQVSETEYVTLKKFNSLQKRLKELEIENEILKKSHRHIGQESVSEYVPYIQSNIDKYKVKQMCKVLKFPRSTYYATVKHVSSKRAQEYDEFSHQVLTVYIEFKIYSLFSK